MLYINDKCLIGRKFYVNDPTIEYIAVGYGQNDTCFIVGENDRKQRTFKLSDVTFVEKLASDGYAHST